MDLAIIGAILRNRIKEMGYTQEEFAEELHIGKASLTKYMSGKTAYNIELLELFSQKLDCSYDYLLGYSNSPKREYHEISEQTHLSQEAIYNLTETAKIADKNGDALFAIKLIEKILCHESLVFDMLCYFGINKSFEKIVENINQKIFSNIKKQNGDSFNQEINYINSKDKLIYFGNMIASIEDIKSEMQNEIMNAERIEEKKLAESLDSF